GKERRLVWGDAIGEQCGFPRAAIQLVDLEELAAAHVLAEKNSLRIAGEKVRAVDRLFQESELEAGAHRPLHQMHLRGGSKAGGDQQLLSIVRLIEQPRAARIEVLADARLDLRWDGRDSTRQQVRIGWNWLHSGNAGARSVGGGLKQRQGGNPWSHGRARYQGGAGDPRISSDQRRRLDELSGHRRRRA